MSELVSTRDPYREIVSYSEALLAGLGKYGGLLVPERYPELTEADLNALQDQPYQDVVVEVHGRFVDGIPLERQQEIAREAYDKSIFPEAEDGNIVPLRELTIDGVRDIFLQDLSGGPTAAFKDVPMQHLAREMDYALERLGRTLEMAGATSGDTGSAAEAAILNVQRIISLFMLSPFKGMSPVQRGQMAAFSGGNIVNISVKGSFDDCQSLVKELHQDAEFAALGAVNSINWGRITAQIPYYVSGYLQAIQAKDGQVGDPLTFVVPSGNFGNILAGHIFRRMTDLPIKLIAATNENDVLHELIQTGVYRARKKTEKTSSPSMDISKASNYERLVYELLGDDPIATTHYMKRFMETGQVSFEDVGLPADSLLRAGFDSGRSTHRDRKNIITGVFALSRQSLLVDPHTADGLMTAINKQKPGEAMVVMSTARPVKFEKTIHEALGNGMPANWDEQLKRLQTADPTDKFMVIRNDPDELKDVIRSHRRLLGQA